MELQDSSWSDALALGKCKSSTRSSSGTPRWCLSPRARWRDPGHYSKGRFCEELGLSSSLCWRSGPGPSQVITICLPIFPLWFPRDVVFNLLRVVWSRCSASSGSSLWCCPLCYSCSQGPGRIRVSLCHVWWSIDIPTSGLASVSAGRPREKSERGEKIIIMLGLQSV